jgi:glycerol-3-phosphate dehydrogenase
MNSEYDIIIIGAGIIGTAAAREFSRYSSSILLLEKGRDAALGATRANSGIVHGGYTAKAGTRKGEFSIRGNRMYRQLSEELGFAYRRTGSLVLAFDEEQRLQLQGLLENGICNGVEELELRTAAAVLADEPGINGAVREALYCGETGIVSPYEAAIAFCEHALSNGAVLKLNSEAVGIETASSGFKVALRSGEVFTGQAVLNAAGLYSDRVASMAGADTFSIRPRKGEYLLLQRGSAARLHTVVFQTPTDKGKGVLVTPTVWGNLMLGPNAEDIEDREDVSSSYAALKDICTQASLSMPGLKLSTLIRYFSGVRPASDRGDFIVGESRVPGFFQAAGIESPGLTSAPAIAESLSSLLREKGCLASRKRTFYAFRAPITLPEPLKPFSEIKEYVDLPPGSPQRIVCRCEQVREETIIDALSRGIPIDSTDAVKRRTRAGMGPCQGTFCGPRVRELIRLRTGLSDDEIAGPQPKDVELLKALRKLPDGP